MIGKLIFQEDSLIQTRYTVKTGEDNKRNRARNELNNRTIKTQIKTNLRKSKIYLSHSVERCGIFS